MAGTGVNEDPFLALMPVVKACNELDIAYYVGGSLASSLHGVPRATNGVDVIAALRPRHVEPFVSRLADAYYIDGRMILDGLMRNIPANLIHLATMVKIDLYGEPSMPFTREALLRARKEDLPGCPMPIRFATPEDVLLAKLKWYLDGGQRSERQWGDLLGILRVQGGALDQEYIDRWLDALHVREIHVRLQHEV